jgi:hypothetical protein
MINYISYGYIVYSVISYSKTIYDVSKDIYNWFNTKKIENNDQYKDWILIADKEE